MDALALKILLLAVFYGSIAGCIIAVIYYIVKLVQRINAGYFDNSFLVRIWRFWIDNFGIENFIRGAGYRRGNVNETASKDPTTKSDQALEIPMEFSIAKSGFKCPICSVEVVEDAAVVICSKCKTPAHKDCFEFNGKCGVFACGNEISATLISGSNKTACEQGHPGFPQYNPYNCPDCGRLIT